MGTRNFTVQEGINVGLGAGGSSYMVVGTTAVTLRTIAITVLTACKFTSLISASGNSAATSAGASGDGMDSDVEFPAGVTIYGDWTSVNVAAGAVILYHG